MSKMEASAYPTPNNISTAVYPLLHLLCIFVCHLAPYSLALPLILSSSSKQATVYGPCSTLLCS